MLQSRIHALEDQVEKLTSHNAKVQPTDKKQRTTGSILFKNVESATAIANSKLAQPQQPRWYNFHPFIWHIHKLYVHHRPPLLHKHASLYITCFGKSNFVIGFGLDSINHNNGFDCVKLFAIECSVVFIIDKLFCISNLETRFMLWSELVMRHMVICYNLIYISLWPAWIRFGFCLKKGFVLYRELIQIVTIIQLPAGQFVEASRPCSFVNWNDSVFSVTNGFVKQNEHAQDDEFVYNWLRPDFIWLSPSLWLSLLLFDLDYVTPSKWNLWWFLVDTVTHVSFWCIS